MAKTIREMSSKIAEIHDMYVKDISVNKKNWSRQPGMSK